MAELQSPVVVADSPLLPPAETLSLSTGVLARSLPPNALNSPRLFPVADSSDLVTKPLFPKVDHPVKKLPAPISKLSEDIVILYDKALSKKYPTMVHDLDRLQRDFSNPVGDEDEVCSDPVEGLEVEVKAI